MAEGMDSDNMSLFKKHGAFSMVKLSSEDDLTSALTFTQDDGQAILVTLADPGICDQEISVSDTSAGPILAVSDSSTPAVHNVLDVLVTTANKSDDMDDCLYQLEEQSDSGLKQNWITSKTDKRALKDQGHRWKQGQFTNEENELLRLNISRYCEERGIDDPNSIIFDTSKDMRKDFYRVIAKGLDRPLFSVYRRVIRMYDRKNHIGKYSSEEINKLRELRKIHGNDWSTIGAALGRSAGSVRDRCRLMKDYCRYGTWQHDEEMRLTAAVYELSGAQPGEEVHHGLCWADVAAKVETRTEKQCRAKWLNFLNWKNKGGAEWSGAVDDGILLEKILASGAKDETELDWVDLSKGWACSRSPQWLRSKWWTLKRHVPNYQTLPFPDLLTHLVLMSSSGSKKSRVADGGLGGHSGNGYFTVSSKCLPTAVPLRLAPTIQLPDGSHAVLSDELSVDSNPLHFITANNTFLITNPSDSLAFPISSSSEPLVVHTLPLNEASSGSDVSSSDVNASLGQHNHDDTVLLDEVTAISKQSAPADCRDDNSEVTMLHLSSLSDPLLNGESANDLNTDS